MLKDNILNLRREKGLSQEALAERVGVSRQTIAKWENAESVPDVLNCKALAQVLEVTLDDLVSEDWNGRSPVAAAMQGKYMFGVATVSERGQIAIPVKARRLFDIQPGDELMWLGDIQQGLALVKADFFLEALDQISQQRKGNEK